MLCVVTNGQGLAAFFTLKAWLVSIFPQEGDFFSEIDLRVTARALGHVGSSKECIDSVRARKAEATVPN